MNGLKKQNSQKPITKNSGKISAASIGKLGSSINSNTKSIEKKSLTPVQSNNPFSQSKLTNPGVDRKSGTMRFQELSKLIVNRVDDILQKNPNPFSISDSNLIYDNDDDKSTTTDKSDYNKKKNTFLTDVELLRMEKENEVKYNLTDLPDLPAEDRNLLWKEHLEFREMLNEIESCRQQYKSEKDDLEYLIKYVKDTKSNVKKHMNGVSNVITKVGINKNIVSNNVEDSDSGSDGEQLFYNKEKNISKITNKLFDITNNVIGYHQNLSKGMEKVEKRNKKYADGNVKVKVDENENPKKIKEKKKNVKGNK
jgi:hypothetical protein